MPIYAYRCQACGEKFEQFRGIYDSDKEVACPKCGRKDPRRVLGMVYGQGRTSRGNLVFPT